MYLFDEEAASKSTFLDEKKYAFRVEGKKTNSRLVKQDNVR